VVSDHQLDHDGGVVARISAVRAGRARVRVKEQELEAGSSGSSMKAVADGAVCRTSGTCVASSGRRKR
jgi:hypothetical protein